MGVCVCVPCVGLGRGRCGGVEGGEADNGERMWQDCVGGIHLELLQSSFIYMRRWQPWVDFGGLHLGIADTSVTEHDHAFVMGGRRQSPNADWTRQGKEKKKKKSQMKKINSPPTSHCVMDPTFISGLSTNAFGFILHLSVYRPSSHPPCNSYSFIASWS